MNYAYIRVSSDKQSVENQKFEILKYCDKNRLQIDSWIEETESGTKKISSRKIGEVLTSMEKGDLLILSELSRLGRNLMDVMKILHDCMEIPIVPMGNDYKEITSIKKAAERFKDNYNKYKKAKEKKDQSFLSWGDYQQGDSNYFMDSAPIIKAIILGQSRYIGRMVPTLYIIHESKEGSKDWYFQALEIVKESIENVLKQPDIENYYMHWSG